MQLLSDQEATRWCAARSLETVHAGRRARYLGFVEQHSSIVIDPGVKGMRTIGLARLLLIAGSTSQDDANFRGGLLWLRDWEIGSPELEAVGWEVLRLLRGRCQEPTELAATPAQGFSQSELLDAHLALAQPLMFGWDAYWVPEDASFFAFIHHHDVVHVVARERHLLESMGRRLSEGQWKSQSGPWPPEPLL
jgi:hypothetical protein